MPPKRNALLSALTQALVSVALLAGAVGIFVVLRVSRPQPTIHDDPPLPRSVEVMPARNVPVRRQWQGFGTAEPRDEADVPAQVTAVVIEIPPGIIAGREVAEGDEFARLDDTDFSIQQQISSRRIDDLDARMEQLDIEERTWTRRVALAGEDVQLTEADYERVKEAYARNAARQREIDQARQILVRAMRDELGAKEQLDSVGPRRLGLAALRAAEEAALRLATKNVARCTIRSPLSGVIQSVDIEVGESVSPGMPVGRVVGLAHVEVPIKLAASARPFVAVGDDVLLESQGSAPQSWTGRVGRIAPADDPLTRTTSVFVDIEQDPRDPDRLAPGKFVLGTVTSARTELRTVVPRRSLLEDRLLLIEDNVVRSRPVEVAFQVQDEFPQLDVEAEQWAVLADTLPDGALVVVHAVYSLPDGLPVRPVVAGQGAAYLGDRVEPGR